MSSDRRVPLTEPVAGPEVTLIRDPLHIDCYRVEKEGTISVVSTPRSDTVELVSEVNVDDEKVGAAIRVPLSRIDDLVETLQEAADATRSGGRSREHMVVGNDE